VFGQVRQLGLIAAIMGVLLMTGVRVSSAADPAEVEALIRKGVKLRRSGENHAALPFFQQAYELGHTPRTAAQLGLVEMSLGYPLDAERHLAESLTTKHDLWVEQNRKVLVESLKSARNSIGSVALLGGPAGAEVQFNGKDAGTLPLGKELRAGEGPADVVIKAEGYRPYKQSITIAGGQRTELTLTLERERPPSAGPPRLPAAPPPVVQREVSEEPSPPTDTVRASTTTRKAAWILTAGSVAATGLAAYQTSVWLKHRDEFDNHIGPSRTQPSVRNKNCGAADPGRGGAGCSEIYQTVDRARTWMIVGYAATGALLVGGLTLFLISGQNDSEAQPSVACAPAGAAIGAVCRFTF
jgi:hypothetical protein